MSTAKKWADEHAAIIVRSIRSQDGKSSGGLIIDEPDAVAYVSAYLQLAHEHGVGDGITRLDTAIDKHVAELVAS